MSFANVAIHFASSVARNLIVLVTVKPLTVGGSRTQLRVKTLLGSWQLLNNVQTARNLLKRTRDATT
jgi:hypothetical protein